MTIAWWTPLLAGVVAWMVGGAWYGVLGERWIAATGKSKEELRPGGAQPMGPMILSFLADLVMAHALAYIVSRAGPVTLAQGLRWALVAWIGFTATSILVNYRFARRDPALTLIDGGHWLAATLAAGAVIGALG